MNIDIGTKIRELRKSKSISIAVLAATTSLSTGLISQLERNLVVPSIVVMWKISNALGVNIGFFFEENGENSRSKVVVRKNDRKKILTSDSLQSYELLMPNLTGKIEFMLVTLHEKNTIEPKRGMVTHEGEECGYVIKGSMKVIISDKTYILNEGDSIYFDSSVPHIYESYDDNECISIWAMTPPSF